MSLARAHRWTRFTTLGLVSAWVVFCAFQPQLPVNPASRLAAVEALVEHQTWALDATTLRRFTIDRVVWEGHTYSSKPPLVALLLAPVHALSLAFGGPRLGDAPYDAALRLTLVGGVLPWMLGCLAMGRLVDRHLSRPVVRTWAFVAWTAASLPVAWAATVDNHSLALLAVLGAMLAWLPVAPERDPPRPLVGAFLAGLAGALDLGALPTGGLVLLVVLAGLFRRGAHRRALLALALFTLPIAAQALVQTTIAGTPLPFYLLPGAYDYPGSYWRAPADLDALREPRLIYAFHALTGHHGLFSLSPLLVLSLPAAWALVRTRTHLRPLALAWTIGAVITIAYYLVTTFNYGGRCAGFRWWLVLHPPLFLLAAAWVDRFAIRPAHAALVGALTAVSALLVLPSTLFPWEESLLHLVLLQLGHGSVPG